MIGVEVKYCMWVNDTTSFWIALHYTRQGKKWWLTQICNIKSGFSSSYRASCKCLFAELFNNTPPFCFLYTPLTMHIRFIYFFFVNHVVTIIYQITTNKFRWDNVMPVEFVRNGYITAGGIRSAAVRGHSQLCQNVYNFVQLFIIFIVCMRNFLTCNWLSLKQAPWVTSGAWSQRDRKVR